MISVSGDELIKELREQTKWLRFLALQALPQLLQQQLHDDRERLAYELTDGRRSTRAIAPNVGVSARTISAWWQRWSAAGIVTTDETGRATRMISLRALGIDVPATADTEVESEVERQ